VSLRSSRCDVVLLEDCEDSSDAEAVGASVGTSLNVVLVHRCQDGQTSTERIASDVYRSEQVNMPIEQTRSSAMSSRSLEERRLCRRRSSTTRLKLVIPATLLAACGMFAFDYVGVPQESAVGTVVGKDITDRGSWRLDLSFDGSRMVALVPAQVYDAASVGGPVHVEFHRLRVDGLRIDSVEPVR
jgi:hypothetical protein